MADAPDPERPPRRRARLASALLSVLAGLGVVVGAWAVLRRRAPQLPVFVEEARPAPAPRPTPSPRPTPTPTPTPSPRPQPAPPAPSPPPDPGPVGTRGGPRGAGDPVADPVDDPVADPVARPVDGPQVDPATGAELLAVSGIGRRSAQALAAGGITTLAAAGRGRRRDARGRPRGRRAAPLPTLSSWPTQARRLLDG